MTNFKTILILMTFGLLCQTCSILNLTTKNWRIEIINKKSDNYDIVVNSNLSTGCLKTKYILNRDSILFINTYLPAIIKTLLDKTESRVEFVNMKTQKDLKFDISFYPKKKLDLQTNEDTLFNILAKKLKFSFSADSVMRKVYVIRIIDADKLKNHIDNSKQSKATWSRDKIEFYGCTLGSIFNDLENGTKIIIDYNLNDRNKYKMIVPRDINKLISYFKNECGIDFMEQKKKVEITKITFKDLK